MLRKLRKLVIGLGHGKISKTSAKNCKFLSTGMPKVESILTKVKQKDGLCQFIPHIEYLVGSNRKAFGGDNAGACLDISDKTQLILQSSHPVRFIIEREIKSLGEEDSLRLKYQDWVALFGRSLQTPLQSSLLESDSEEKRNFHDKLCSISTASECGMFSSDIHQTVVNIPNNLPPSKIVEFNLGNKYAVLVGDYFAIKTIYFAEKVKSSPVLLDVVRGVEDFAYSSFVSRLMDWEIGYPILPNEDATLDDWIAYGVKASGYFTGGLKAARTFTAAHNHNLRAKGKGLERPIVEAEEAANLTAFISRLALTLKAIADLKTFEQKGGSTPFLFISLPAIVYQLRRPGAFREFRNFNYKVDQGKVLEMQEKIAGSEAIPETLKLISELSAATIKAFEVVGLEPFYSQVVVDLLNAVSSFED